MIADWNSIPESITASDSAASFKTLLLVQLCPYCADPCQHDVPGSPTDYYPDLDTERSSAAPEYWLLCLTADHIQTDTIDAHASVKHPEPVFSSVRRTLHETKKVTCTCLLISNSQSPLQK